MKKISVLTRVQKFVKENNIPVFNMGEQPKGGSVVVEPKENLRVVFTDAEDCRDNKRKYSIVWFDPTNKDKEPQYEIVKTQKQLIEKYMEVAGAETTEKVIEKSAIAPLETPVKITPEVTAMNVSRESESARLIEKKVKLNSHLKNNGCMDISVLDYGCGLGRNIKYLIENSVCWVDGCDTHDQIQNIKKDTSKMEYFNERNVMLAHADYYKKYGIKYDMILNSHVLNVVPDDIKKIIISDMYELLKDGGQAVIQVRTESDVASAKTKEKYGDGWLIKKGKETTYQEGITKEKMNRMLTDAGFKIINHRFTKSIHIVEVVK